jgi:RNA recognition motif-containing protein
MPVRLYIGNVTYRVTAQELAAACAAVAPVQSIYLPFDKETGRPRGFGFVEVADEIEAERLMAQLNGLALQGRELVVHPARPREEHPQRTRDNHPSHGSAGRSGSHGGGHGHSRGGRPPARP